MAKTIAIVNQKGGVGKTTTCVNLAAALKNQGCRVLVCDFDPQANTTSGFGVDKTTSPNIYARLEMKWLCTILEMSSSARLPLSM